MLHRLYRLLFPAADCSCECWQCGAPSLVSEDAALYTCWRCGRVNGGPGEPITVEFEAE